MDQRQVRCRRCRNESTRKILPCMANSDGTLWHSLHVVIAAEWISNDGLVCHSRLDLASVVEWSHCRTQSARKDPHRQARYCFVTCEVLTHMRDFVSFVAAEWISNDGMVCHVRWDLASRFDYSYCIGHNGYHDLRTAGQPSSIFLRFSLSQRQQRIVVFQCQVHHFLYF